MATNILMPALSPTMTEGTLSRWLKHEGDAVAPGDVLAEIETDKATMEVEAVDEGVLGRILVGEGTGGVAVNTPIAVLIGEGETVPAPDASGVPTPAAPAAASVPEAAPAPAPVPAPRAEAPSAGPAPGPRDGVANSAAGTGRRVIASPLARRIARDGGIALDGIKGSGPNGRIVRADVDGAIAGRKAAGAPAAPIASAAPAARPQPKPAAPPAEKVATVPNSGMRRAIARRLSESVNERPHFYVTMDVELDALLELRTKLNRKSPKEGEDGAFKLSVNDMLIKAAALAHRRVPGVAVSYTDEAILHFETIDISIAVSIPDGLITPIVRDADRKSVVAISNEAKALVARARAGKLKPDEFQGGAFSISNLGMFGVREFTAIINPPQAAILALGAGEKRPVVRGEALAIATVMTATLSSDHRAVDGALAARWLGAFKEIVQDPLELLL